jgi:2-polyprenyl-3-methyl-5-hydroxy-6-metoxy-1,4-benzoquinol methylase
MTERPNNPWRDDIRFQTKYAQKNPISRYLTAAFLRRIGELAGRVGQGARVLDAGCGEGITLRHLSAQRPDLELHGIEIDAASLDVARELVPTARLREGSIYELPWPDAEFDLVLCTEVLEHLEEPDKALAGLRRVARDAVILSVPREPLWRLLNMARGAYWADWGNTPTHINHWGRSAFRRLVAGHFSVREAGGPNPWTVIWAGAGRSATPQAVSSPFSTF